MLNIKFLYNTVAGRVAIMCALLILSSWVHIPFSPLSWNFSFFVSVMLAIHTSQKETLCAALIWITLGMYVGALPAAMKNISAPWGGYIWGELPMVWFVGKLRKSVSTWVLWGIAWCIIESLSMLHYACTSPSILVAKYFGLCALLPWHGAQCVCGTILTNRLKHFFSLGFRIK